MTKDETSMRIDNGKINLSCKKYKFSKINVLESAVYSVNMIDVITDSAIYKYSEYTLTAYGSNGSLLEISMTAI